MPFSLFKPHSLRFNRAKHRKMWSVYEFMEHNSVTDWKAWSYHHVMAILVIISVVSILIEVTGGIPNSWMHKVPYWLLDNVDRICVIAFTLDYGLRVWSAPAAPHYHYLPFWLARLKSMFTPMMMIDLLSILPFYLIIFIDFQKFGIDIEIIRIIRLLRILRLTRESTAVQAMLGVLQREKSSLLASLILISIVALFTATLMVTLEGEAQPNHFGDLFSSLWWVTVTMTTVGYGDVVPITHGGRVVASLLMFSGLGLFALWTGLVASTFVDELSRRSFTLTASQMSKLPSFAHCSATEIEQCRKLGQPIQLEARHLLIRVGEPGDHMYFIISGSVEVLLSSPITLSEGDFFGDAAFLLRQRRNANVVTLEPCRLLRYSRADFLWMVKSIPALRNHIETVTGRRTHLDHGSSATHSFINGDGI